MMKPKEWLGNETFIIRRRTVAARGADGGEGGREGRRGLPTLPHRRLTIEVKTKINMFLSLSPRYYCICPRAEKR